MYVIYLCSMILDTPGPPNPQTNQENLRNPNMFTSGDPHPTTQTMTTHKDRCLFFSVGAARASNRPPKLQKCIHNILNDSGAARAPNPPPDACKAKKFCSFTQGTHAPPKAQNTKLDRNQHNFNDWGRLCRTPHHSMKCQEIFVFSTILGRPRFPPTPRALKVNKNINFARF